MRKHFLFFAVFILVATTSVFATDYPRKDFLMQLYSSNDSCILSVDEGKYYLDLNKICIRSDGIFLISDFFGPLALTNLMYDNVGMYTIECYGHWMCSSCGACYSSRPSECSVCGGTSFRWVDDLPED